VTEVTEVTGVTDLLAAAVTGIKSTERPGQVTMARAVQRTIVSGEHLAVRAGDSCGPRALILRWNCAAWTQIYSPRPLAATSSRQWPPPVMFRQVRR
jgi:hypothetical protein